LGTKKLRIDAEICVLKEKHPEAKCAESPLFTLDFRIRTKKHEMYF